MRHVLARLLPNMDVRPVKDSDAKAFRDDILNMRTTILEKLFIVRVKHHGDNVLVDDTQ